MKAVVITGAAGSIGAAAAEAFLSLGWRAFLLDNDKPRLDQVTQNLPQAGLAQAVVCDVSAADEVAAAFQQVEAEDIELAGLINTAAVVNHRAHLLDLKEADFDRLLAVNLKGVFLCAQAAAQIMSKQGGGSIVNIGSVSSRRAHREQAAYDAAKGGVEALTRAMALDLAPYAIRVNAVLPAAISTETMVAHSPQEFAQKTRLVPLGRYGTPQEVAQICEFLITRGGFITGQSIVIDGGLDIQLRALDAEYIESTHFAQRLKTR